MCLLLFGEVGAPTYAHVDLALDGGLVERRVVPVVPGVGVGSLTQQQRHHLKTKVSSLSEAAAAQTKHCFAPPPTSSSSTTPTSAHHALVSSVRTRRESAAFGRFRSAPLTHGDANRAVALAQLCHRPGGRRALLQSCESPPDASTGDRWEWRMGGRTFRIFKAHRTHLHERQTPASTAPDQQNSLKFCSGVNGLGGVFFIYIYFFFFSFTHFLLVSPRRSRQSRGRRLNPSRRSIWGFSKRVLKRCCVMGFRSGSGCPSKADAALMIIGYRAILHHLGRKIKPVDFRARRPPPPLPNATERRVEQVMEGTFPQQVSALNSYFLLLLTQREKRKDADSSEVLKRIISVTRTH